MLIARGDYVWTGEALVADGAVVCDGGTIAAVGSWAALREAYPDAEVVGGEGIIVVPGFINAHHHGQGVTSFMRGVEDDCLEPWLARSRNAVGTDPYLSTLWAALGLVQGGYTAVALFQSTADPLRAGDEARARIRACRDVGLRVALGLDLIQQHWYVYGPDPAGLPPRTALSAEAYIALLEELRREFAGDEGVAVFAAPSGPQWVTDATWEAIGEWTHRNGVPLHTHCNESIFEGEYARRVYGGSAAAYLDERGALHHRTALVHGVYLTEVDLDVMARQGAQLITNPGSNLRLKCGVGPVLTALRKGITVALGTDGCTLGDRDDVLAEMRLLFYLQRVPGMDTPALTWQEAVHAATGGAAAVTPWRGRAGVIKEGALADLSLFNLQEAAAPWSHPDIHPVHLLLHRGSRAQLEAVVVGGSVIWQAQKGSLRVDEAEAAQRLRDDMASRPLKPERPDYSDIVVSFYRGWQDGR